MDATIFNNYLKKLRVLDRKTLSSIGRQSLRIYHHSREAENEVKEILKEYLQILEKQYRILSFLERGIAEIDEEETIRFMEALFLLGNKTSLYYKEILKGLEKAIKGKEQYGERPQKQFQTLLETSDYEIWGKGLLLSTKDIIEYLGYPTAFWEYIFPKVSIRDHHQEAHHFFYLVNVKCEEGRIVDMHVGVPKIINLETALINIHEFKHAYDLYERIGKPFVDESTYEESAKEKERNFVKEYVSQKNWPCE